MVNFRRRTKINRIVTTITGITPTDIIAAQSGFSIGLTNVQITNRVNYPIEVTLYEEGDKILPSIPLGASGTYLWENPAGEQLELGIGSGLQASVSFSGESAEIGVLYVLHDETTPISKEQARSATFIASNATATRTPNQAGNQSKS